jgi:hypothetical protein
MGCPELDNLRQQARELNLRLKEQRRKARANAGRQRGAQPPGRSDYESLLQRKIDALGAKIDSHVAQHDCEP